MKLADLFEGAEHEAKPLLAAATKWAENEGKTIAKEVEADLKAVEPKVLTAFVVVVNQVLPGFTPDEAKDLLATAIARFKAAELAGTSVRASVLNAGVETAVLLLKGEAGDTKTAPPTAKSN